MPPTEDDLIQLIVGQLSNLHRSDKEGPAKDLPIEERPVEVDRFVYLRRRVEDQVAKPLQRQEQRLLVRLRSSMKGKAKVWQPYQLRFRRVAPLEVVARFELQKERIPHSVSRLAPRRHQFLLVDEFVRQDKSEGEL